MGGQKMRDQFSGAKTLAKVIMVSEGIRVVRQQSPGHALRKRQLKRRAKGGHARNTHANHHSPVSRPEEGLLFLGFATPISRSNIHGDKERNRERERGENTHTTATNTTHGPIDDQLERPEVNRKRGREAGSRRSVGPLWTRSKQQLVSWPPLLSSNEPL